MRRLQSLHGGTALSRLNRGDHLLSVGVVDADSGHVRVVRGSEIQARRIEWLWGPYIPLGAITMLVGDPGLGKSQLALSLAAQLTRNELPVSGDVLVATVEDSPEAVVKPRMELCGAHHDRWHHLSVDRDGIEQGIALPDDLGELERLVERHDVRLVVIDPLMAHLPESVNSFRDQSVRRALAPLHRIADEHSCAVLVVAHLNKATTKDPTYRAGGSIGLPAAARSGLLLGRDPDDEEAEEGSRRVLAQFKSNYGEIAASRAYRIEAGRAGPVETSRIVACGESPYSAWDLLNPPDEEERSALEEAVAFLEAEVGAGWKPAVEVIRLGVSGSARKLQSEKKKAGVRSKKDGSSWIWGPG